MIGRAADEDGFTLVELLVSLVITAAAAGLLTATLGAARTARVHDEAAAAAIDGIAAAQAQMRERIGRLVEEGGTAGGVASATTAGSSSGFSFLAPPPASRPPSGLLRHVLALTPDGTVGFTLTDRADGAIRARLPLVGGVRAFDIAYFGNAPDDPVARWRPRWGGRTDPPVLVRVRIRFAAGDPRVWPDLVIAPAATVNATCTVDPNSGTCA